MNTHHSPRPIEKLVEDNIVRWKLNPVHEKALRRLPVVAISRQCGSLGEQVARRLAEGLGMNLYGDELIGLIAETNHVSEGVVRTLDEKGVTFMDDMLAALNEKYSMMSNAYFDVLARAVAAIDRRGNAVILGRGAAYMIHGRGDLKIRFTAPVNIRIKNTMRELNLSEDEAKQRLITIDADRARFVNHYFRVDAEDVRHFDLVVNNESLDLEASVEIVKAALRNKMRGRK